MKKIISILASFCFMIGAFAQSDIPSGTLNLHVGPSFQGGVGAMFTGEYEVQMFDDNLTIGPSLGIGVSRYSYIGYTHPEVPVRYYSSAAVFHPSVVAHYYFDWLIDDMPSKFDLFGKANAGFWFVTNGDLRGQGYFLPFTVGLYAGGRYHVNSNASLYLTLGYGASYLNIGFSKKF